MTTVIEEQVAKVDGRAEADCFSTIRIMLWEKRL